MKKGGTSSLTHRLVSAVQLCLVALIFYVLARAVIVFITPESAWVVPQTSSGSVPTARTVTAQSYDFSFDPFHRDVPVIETAIGEDAPETTLNLKLYGLRAGEGGSAILQTPDRVQGVYEIGDEIINGVTLKAVNSRYIVLSQNGQLERLTFDGEDETGLRAPPSAQADQTTPALSSQNALDTVTKMSAGDLMSAIALTRVTEDGRVMGYRLTPKRADVNLTAFGLKSGDIITHIGSEDLTLGRPEFGALIAELSQARSVDLKLIRGGNVITINVGS